ncbi:hypothetical protein L5515_013074 [Caenorhabditis briggsae]|uniref:BTB domain-containing protein n=1 Tax=Caenorhabditis briggsae TaxID=6238 RepID=A0AAE9EAA8_CAEBR|nr:hypothetical protein L5515_013074 [Caenorhabditis briggsae]
MPGEENGDGHVLLEIEQFVENPVGEGADQEDIVEEIEEMMRRMERMLENGMNREAPDVRRFDPLALAEENHLDVLRIQERIRELERNRWQIVDDLADGGRILQELEDVARQEEEEEEDVDWVTPLARTYTKPFSTDWFGDDRESLSDLAKFYNSPQFSDVNLKIGEESFPAHRLILSKSSDVFDRMLSQRWNGDRLDLQLTEDPMCQIAFSSFLRFLYCNHVVLHRDNCLPLLVLADKYNVTTLKKVCLDFAQSEILPIIDLKEIFSVWFSYATKAYHPSLIKSCMEVIALDFDALLSEEWEKDWQELHRDQMVEILKCNELQLANEFKLWEALLKWIQAPSHSERRGNTAGPLMALLLPLIRFPFMTADELSQVEKSNVSELHSKLFQLPLLLAYKFQALPLASRMTVKDFTKKQFLLRKYRDIRWDRRINLSKSLLSQPCRDHAFTFDTRSSTYPNSEWKWTLKLSGLSGLSSNPVKKDVLRVLMIAEGMDQSRCIEYLFQIVNEKNVLFSTSGKKSFTKTRYYSELEMEKKIEFDELLNDESSYSCNREFIFQVLLKPID